MSRSYFKTALEVLTCLRDDVFNIETICTRLNINPALFEEIYTSLDRWGLIETIGSRHTITEKGHNVYSYYHNTKMFFDIDFKPQNKLKEIRARIEETP